MSVAAEVAPSKRSVVGTLDLRLGSEAERPFGAGLFNFLLFPCYDSSRRLGIVRKARYEDEFRKDPFDPPNRKLDG